MPAAPKETVLVPALNVAFAAVAVQLPLTVIAAAFAVTVPFVPMVTEAAVIPKFEADVSRTVLPVGLPIEFWIRRAPFVRTPWEAIVYVTPAATLESKVTFPRNSIPPGHAVPQRVIVCEAALLNLMAAAKDQDADVVVFVHAPVTVHVPPVLIR